MLAIHYYKPLEKRTYTVKVLVRLNASGSIILIGLSESILEKRIQQQDNSRALASFKLTVHSFIVSSQVATT